MSARLPDAMVLVRTKTRQIEVIAKSELLMHWAIGGTMTRDASAYRKLPTYGHSRTFKPGRFVIEKHWDAFQVLDLRVGKDSQFRDPKARPGKEFQPDGPPGFRPYGDEFDTALPGVMVIAKLFNKTTMPVTLRCHWLGLVVVPADRPLEPADELEAVLSGTKRGVA